MLHNDSIPALWRLIERHFEEYLACFALLVMAALVFVQVVIRYVFNSALSWTDEVAVYCMLWTVYLSASWAVRERAHIRVTNLLTSLPQTSSFFLVFASDAMWFAACAVVSWQGILLNQSLWQQQYLSPVLKIDQKWPYLVIPIGFGLMLLRLIQVYYRWIRFGESILGRPAVSERIDDGRE